jgi:hypothetical protein
MGRFAVEAWAPEYGSVADEAALTQSEVPTDLDVEVPEAKWGPRDPPATTPAPRSIVFVDGVRRVDARVWLAAADGTHVQGICASYGAGAVRSEGSRAVVVDARVERGVFARALNGQDPAPIEADVGNHRMMFLAVPVPSEDFEQLSLRLQAAMGRLEARLAEATVSPSGGELIVVDGPLRERLRVPGAVGYVKHHEAGYGPAQVRSTVASLAAGQRTPVFMLGERFPRYSWYVRLPGPSVSHPLAGIVRCEAGTDDPVDAVVALADLVTAALPRFASVAHKDPRAPQNLFPIAGLERLLRRRLGDPGVVLRALRAAAARS